MTFIANMSIFTLFACLGFVISEDDPDLHPEHDFFDISFVRNQVSRCVEQEPLNEQEVNQLKLKYRKHNFSQFNWRINPNKVIAYVARMNDSNLRPDVIPNLVVQRLSHSADTVYLRRHAEQKTRVFLLEKHEKINEQRYLILQVADVADVQ